MRGLLDVLAGSAVLALFALTIFYLAVQQL